MAISDGVQSLAAARLRIVEAARERVRSLLAARIDDGDGDILHIVGPPAPEPPRKRRKKAEKPAPAGKKQEQTDGTGEGTPLPQSDDD